MCPHRSINDVYRFIKAERANFSITFMCRAFVISGKAYDSWHARQCDGKTPKEQKDEAFTAKVEEVFTQSNKTYGSPRVAQKLNKDGIACSQGKVEAVMAKEEFVHCTNHANQ